MRNVRAALDAELNAILAKTVRSEKDEKKAHALFSASGSKRWLNCPGSINLCENLPPLPESVYAAEGTKAHACFEFLLKNYAQLPQAMSISRKHFSEEMINHAFDAVCWIMQKAPEGAEVISERRVDASLFTCSKQFGTVDSAIIEDFGRLVVIDYKYGAGVAVDVHDDDGRANSQLAYYGLGLSYEYGHNFSEVELVVIQPRAFHPNGPIRSRVMPMAEILAWKDIFREGVMATGDRKAPLRAGDWCKWCPAGVVCPELKGGGLAKAQVVFSDMSGIEAVPELKMVGQKDLGTILDGCDQLESWIEKVRSFAMSEAMRGREPHGYKLVEKRAQRKWANPDKSASILRRHLGDEAFSKPKLLSPAQIEKQFDGMSDWLAMHTVKESSGVNLVKAKDKRPKTNPIANVFSVIDIEVVKTPPGRKKQPWQKK